MNNDSEELPVEEEQEQPQEQNEEQQASPPGKRSPRIPPRVKRRPRKHKFIAGLLAAVLPGTGHLYFGLLRKGISFIFIILLDIAALLYFSSIGMQINVPLLIILALLIPVLYFYNVFDVLQLADRRIRLPEDQTPTQAQVPKGAGKRRAFVTEPGISFGFLLLFGGAMLVFFRQKPAWLQFFIEHYAQAATALVLLAIGLLLGVREIVRGLSRRRGKDNRRRRVGRYTAAMLLAGIAVPLFLDWSGDTDYMLLLLKWWPVIPVLWGLELLLIYFFARRSGRTQAGARARLDLRGLLSAVLVAACVFIVAEQEHYLHLWNRVSLNLTAAAVDYGEAEGSRFEKPAIAVPVELDTAKLSIDGINGDILLHRAAVEDIEIVTTVWVDQLEGAMAEAISEQSFIEVVEGPTIKLISKSKAYGDSGKRQPRMDLDISLPEDRRFNLEIRTMNGRISLQNVEAIENISLETGNGELVLHRVLGNVKGKTLNGPVRARMLQGSAELTTSGGDMDAWDVTGALQMTTAVGNITATRSGAEVEISSKNGNLDINEARSKLKAESLNGGIRVRSPYLEGDWNIYSAVGDIMLYLPAEGNYKIMGSSGYGNIVTDLPGLVIDKKTISGELGTGEYQVEVEGNSNLNVSEY
ncbi:DUF4097 family beta strand repeat-containing protein [Paenibacillus donghaensis]|uniref:DUF4097 domain-containing protein n=1 Tax=Paenibacillus donghaensis TaxID=414771 RepID=A0A2Z2KL56_9BACL|nr:DUF4097 family beta strand repeat-containing protein [Paenibacillus donghaensis]ASA24140.1 hypothetical protein B9T62_27255 [Paenibacillus donghaensis]